MRKKRKEHFSSKRWLAGRGKCPFCNKRPRNPERYEHILSEHQNEMIKEL
jgi:hypothetical protein